MVREIKPILESALEIACEARKLELTPRVYHIERASPNGDHMIFQRTSGLNGIALKYSLFLELERRILTFDEAVELANSAVERRMYWQCLGLTEGRSNILSFAFMGQSPQEMFVDIGYKDLISSRFLYYRDKRIKEGLEDSRLSEILKVMLDILGGAVSLRVK